jgi:hypothetical protein
MNPKETAIIIKCDCGCSMFAVEKSEWEDGEINYWESLKTEVFRDSQ